MRSDNPILLLEDDIVDAMTVKRALKEVGVDNEVIHMENGEEALEYLQNEKLEDPCIILLDLNMPVMNGIEFLQERMKSDDLMAIPVIVLTTSKDDFDKSNCFKLSIAGYMVKPVDYTEFIDVIRTINRYWTISETADD